MLAPAVAAVILAMIANGRPRLAGALGLFTVILLPWLGARLPADAQARRRAWAGLLIVFAGAGALFAWGISAGVAWLVVGVVATIVGTWVMYGRPPIFGGSSSGS